MERNLWTSHDHNTDEEDLFANVVSLRSRLKKTERNLQDLGEELYVCVQSTNSYNPDDTLEILTMEDLTDPSELHNCSTQSSLSRMPWHNRDSSRKHKNKCYSLSLDKTLEEENEILRDKLNIVREKNASLTSQNHHLMNKIETINYELNQSRARISFLESTLSTHSVSIPMLEEQIASLEAEVQAQDKALKEAEDKLEESQKRLMEKEYSFQKLKEEYKEIRFDLIEQCKQGKRTECQRNEALFNAEELTRTFKKYKEKISEKLEKVQEEEQTLERNLMNCVKEKEKLHAKCNSYRSELESTKEQVRQLTEENSIGKENLRGVEAKCAEMEVQLKHSQQTILKLENKLQVQDTVLEEKNTLLHEIASLKALVAQQNDHLKLYHQEIENSRTELKTLENIISQLSQSSPREASHSMHHSKEASCPNCCDLSRSLIEELRLKLTMKEALIQQFQAETMTSNPCQDLFDESERQELNGLEIEPVKLTGNQTERKHQQLELVAKQFEKVKQRLHGQLEELRTKLEKCEAENSFLKETMAQRTSQFQTIQDELLEKAAKSSSLEREAARKSSRLSALEKQLEEKTLAYTTAAEKNTELERELVEVNAQLHSLERNFNEEHGHLATVLKKTKMIHHEHQKELEKQIELLESRLETRCQQFHEQENTMSLLQQDILCKQRQIESLDLLLIESKEEMENQKTKKEEAIRILQSQFTEETIKVRQLQAALDDCKEDLAVYLSNLEESKVLFEKQLAKKNDEIQRLHKEIKLKNNNLQSTSEQNFILQQTLQQQQQMLNQETIRNCELEDSQIKLQQQVLKLEQELQKQKEIMEEELRKTTENLHLVSEEADLKRQKIAELTGTIRQIKIEMDQCKDELIDMEKELVHLRRDGHAKASQLGHLEMTLEEKHEELQKKTQQVKQLEDKLLQAETQQKDSEQKIGTLETDLQNATGKLKTSLRQLQELRNMLQETQLALEEKYAAIENLTEELRDCKDELENKRQELLEMEKILKERNWDLKQRAAQVTQLDMSIREHRGELEQKIIKLEGNLEKAELQIKECNRQIESLESKLQHSKGELQEKELIILQQDQEINRLKKETGRKQEKVTDIEKKVEEQERFMAEQHKEILDLGQQLRLEREQMKKVHLELLESRRQQAQAQRDVDRLSLELEEVNHLSHEKESRTNHLAEQLGAAQAREAQLEARMRTEIRRLSAEIHSLKQSYTSEKLLHETEETKRKESISKSHHLYGQLQQLKLDLEDAQGTVCNLQEQLQSRNDMIDAANEALLLKESEVTRLQARIAGHERTESIKQLSAPQNISTHQWLDQEPDFDRHSQRKSASTNDPSFKDDGNLLKPKNIFTTNSLVICRKPKDTIHDSPKSPDESSFDPLTHIVEEDETCDSSDFQTLSGMLKYINKEMSSENSP
ncbi:Coiled-coil domain containing 18 [Podarcis lilfordi]|uniref:Coiled-coil domain containing 18 n=1 Tax=Podarcis lilfordi TaxID=74358 RepID=A0AA35P6D2_9SAUR|nr:Coiled-coil domain containing 18 [Podarcis lilfordi]